MHATRQDSPSITVSKSIGNLVFPVFEKEEKEKEGHSPAKLPNLGRAGVAVDLGTPYLGTAWQINGISLYYEKLSAQYFSLLPVTSDQFLYFTTYLFMGSAEIYRESSEKIKFSGAEKRTEGSGPKFDSSLTALQNVPQPLLVPGGQQLLLELAAFENGPKSAQIHVNGELSIGKVTMNYTRIPSGVRSG